MSDSSAPAAARVGLPVPDFETIAYANDQIEVVRLSQFRGRWLVLVFYPADFSMICPTELSELAAHAAAFAEAGVEIAGVSMDSVYVHKAWKTGDVRLKDVRFPLIADTAGELCRLFGTYSESQRMSQRGTFIIDPDGVLKSMELQDNSIGRSTAELLRKIEALQFVREHPGQVCPASWTRKKDAVAVPLRLGAHNF
jgi:peroxiredoxin (alkyl hydroperoxide reductase subunit C)